MFLPTVVSWLEELPSFYIYHLMVNTILRSASLLHSVACSLLLKIHWIISVAKFLHDCFFKEVWLLAAAWSHIIGQLNIQWEVPIYDSPAWSENIKINNQQLSLRDDKDVRMTNVHTFICVFLSSLVSDGGRRGRRRGTFWELCRARWQIRLRSRTHWNWVRLWAGHRR